jgi:hypothetical protein
MDNIKPPLLDAPPNSYRQTINFLTDELVNAYKLMEVQSRQCCDLIEKIKKYESNTNPNKP